MITKRFLIMLSLSVCLLFSLCFSVVATTPTTLTEQMKDIKHDVKSSVYNIDLNAPFSKESSGIRESVSTETGSMTVKHTIFSIPGRNGMDLNLNISYHNLNAKLYNEGTSSNTISKSSTKTVIAFYEVYNSSGYWIRTDALEYSSSESSIPKTTSIGNETWIFNGYYQYIDGTSVLTSNEIENVIHEKSVSQIAKSYHGIGWSLSLPSLDVDGETVYVPLPDGQTYIADSSNASGLKDYKFNDIYFCADNTQSNGIDTSAYKLRYADGNIEYYTEDGEILIQSDRYGNKITYYRSTINGLRLLTKIIDSAGREVTITYDQSGTYFKYGNKTVSLLRTEIPGFSGKYVLSSFIDAEGRKIEYGYNFDKAEFDLINKTNAENTYANLTSIHYPTDLNTNYSYVISKKNLGQNGYMEYFKVSKRWDNTDSKESNLQKYIYSNEPDGYPNYKPSEIDPSYTYSTTVINEEGDSIQYCFDYKHLMYEKIHIRNDVTETKKIRYDERKNVPNRVETRISDGKSSYVKKLALYEYDSRGNMISENHPEDPTDGNSTEYQITYEYDGKYNVPIKYTYKQDKNTTIVVKHQLSKDKKSVINEEMHSNGNSLKYVKYEYDTFGNVIESATRINSKKWAVTAYQYGEEYGFVFPGSITYLDVINADGTKQDIAETFSYDYYSGVLLSKTDGNGNKTTYTYDNLNRMLTETLPDGLSRTYDYDDYDNMITATNANNTTITYQFNPFGLLSSVSELSTEFPLHTREYDTRDNLVLSTDANGNQVKYTYDSSNRITSVTVYDQENNLIEKTMVSYFENFEDTYGNHYFKVTVTKKGTLNDLVTNYYYDGKDMLVKMGRGSGDNEIFSYYDYDYLQNMVLGIGFDGTKAEYHYDALGRLLQTKDAEGGISYFSYDGLSNIIGVTNQMGIETYATYDSLGRMISAQTPQENGGFATTQYFYDASNHITKVIDAQGYKTQYHYTNRGFLQSVQQIINRDQSNIVKLEYDGEGNQTAMYTGLSSLEDTEYSKYSYEYDQFGNVTSEIDAMGYETSHFHDFNGNRIASINRNDVTTWYTYDGLNRLIVDGNNKDGKENEIESQYDLNGNVIKVLDPTGATEYKYDELGRVSEIHYSNGFTKQYTYDKADRVISMTVLQGDVAEMIVFYKYDKMGRLTSVSRDGIRFTYNYNLAGQLVSETNGLTGIESKYEYTPSGKLKSLINYRSGEIVNSYFYEYDVRGNRTKKIENGKETKYYYDALSRLTIAIMPDDMIQKYEHDDYGNIEKFADISGTEIVESLYHYDDNNRLLLKETKSDNVNIDLRFQYDKEGNMIWKEEAAKNGVDTPMATTYMYNGRNQLQSVIDPVGDIYEYQYNFSGLRTSKDTPTGGIQYIYENGNIIVETDENSKITATNLWGHRLLERQTSEDTYGYLLNGHGDIIALTDTMGNVLKEYDYDPYGNEKDTASNTENGLVWNAETDDFDNPFRYCGEYLDAETGAYYLRARYYDPSIGRFTQQDTYKGNLSEPLSLNLYSYCYNNPIRYIDPSGHITQKEEDAFKDGRISKEAYDHLNDLTAQWYAADGNSALQGEIHRTANKFRDDGYLFISNDEKKETANYTHEELMISAEKHYARNSLNALPSDQLDYYLNNENWAEATKMASKYHRVGVTKDTIVHKFVSRNPDKNGMYKEAIFHNGILVIMETKSPNAHFKNTIRDSVNAGTINYLTQNFWDHYDMDMDPYYKYESDEISLSKKQERLRKEKLNKQKRHKEKMEMMKIK